MDLYFQLLGRNREMVGLGAGGLVHVPLRSPWTFGASKAWRSARGSNSASDSAPIYEAPTVWLARCVPSHLFLKMTLAIIDFNFTRKPQLRALAICQKSEYRLDRWGLTSGLLIPCPVFFLPPWTDSEGPASCLVSPLLPSLEPHILMSPNSTGSRQKIVS